MGIIQNVLRNLTIDLREVVLEMLPDFSRTYCTFS